MLWYNVCKDMKFMLGIKKLLYNFFIPHQGNNHKPHAVRHKTLHSLSLSLLMLKVLALVFLFGLYPSPAQFSTITSARIVELVNETRQEEGLLPLKVNPLLIKAAQKKAQDMITKDYFAHNSPDGTTPWEWFKQVGYEYTYAGENLAINFVTAEDAFSAWLASPSHRANILNPNYQEIGVAVAVGEIDGQESTLLVQLFGTSFLPATSTELTQLKQAVQGKSESSLPGQVTSGQIAVEIREAGNESFLAKFLNFSKRFYLLIAFFIIISLLLKILIRIKIQHKPVIIHALFAFSLAIGLVLWHLHFLEAIQGKLIVF